MRERNWLRFGSSGRVNLGREAEILSLGAGRAVGIRAFEEAMIMLAMAALLLSSSTLVRAACRSGNECIILFLFLYFFCVLYFRGILIGEERMEKMKI